MIESLKSIVDGIASVFGSRCEVVLHDLRDIEHSIVKIANGHVTGRAVGGSITDKGLKDLRSGLKQDILINYQSMTKDGRHLRSSSMIFKNDKKKNIAAICINFDVTDILNFNQAIQDMFKVSEESQKDEATEIFEMDIVSTMNEMADKIIRKTGKGIPSMGRKDRIEILRRLEAQGFFLTKGAIKFIAGKLNVSKFTIYNYLEQIHSENQSSGLYLTSGNSLRKIAKFSTARGDERG